MKYKYLIILYFLIRYAKHSYRIIFEKNKIKFKELSNSVDAVLCLSFMHYFVFYPPCLYIVLSLCMYRYMDIYLWVLICISPSNSLTYCFIRSSTPILFKPLISPINLYLNMRVALFCQVLRC